MNCCTLVDLTPDWHVWLTVATSSAAVVLVLLYIWVLLAWT